MSICIESVDYQFANKQALVDLTFTLDEGFHILLGPNGAGKSTLYSLLTGLRKLTTGNILFHGKNMRSDRRWVMSKLGVVFQENALDIDLTVKQNLSYFGALHGLSEKQTLSNIQPVLEQLELDSRLNDKIRNLNGGHKRRVEIARSLIHRPAYLLFDEPTVGLDIGTRRLILNFIREYCNDHHSTVLWATHLLEEVLPTDKLILLSNGRMKGQGICQNLMDDAKLDSISALFDTLSNKKGAH